MNTYKQALYDNMLEYAKAWTKASARNEDEIYAYNQALLDMLDIVGLGDDLDLWDRVNCIFEEV